MSKSPKNIAPANTILKNVIFLMVVAELALYLAFFPVGHNSILNQPQKNITSPAPLSFAGVVQNVRQSDFIANNKDLSDRKNILTDVYLSEYFRNDEPAKEPEPQYAVLAKKTTIVTAYSSTPGQTDASPFITAMGSNVRDGIVAANWLKFGTKIRLPEVYGNKVFVVEDRMASFNRHKLDVWMETRNEALQFGAKKLTVEVVEEID